MGTIGRLVSLLSALTFFNCAAPVFAQEFLNPAPVQSPTFLLTGSSASGAASGAHEFHGPDFGGAGFGGSGGAGVQGSGLSGSSFSGAVAGEHIPCCPGEWGHGCPEGSALPTVPPVPVNNSSNLLTGPGAFQLGVPNGRAYALQGSGNGLLAPQSVSSKGIPSGSYSFGFSKSASVSAGAPRYGRALPSVSTSSVDLNVVDSNSLAENFAPGVYNPFSVDSQLLIGLQNGTVRVVDFQETAAEAATFLQQSQFDSQSPE